jgi:oxygen-independent coproporphyrinogen III oxidase
MASIYIHIPFCERKCFYCDFYSITGGDRIDSFLSALRNEIELSADRLAHERIETIFFGGGTPSLLSPAQIESIITHIGKIANVTEDVETTIEVNPGTIDKEKIRGFLNAGINRLSIGVQSFDDDELKFLQRIHTATDATGAVLDARECGISNLSIDLIYALPQQTQAQWCRTLEKAILLHPEHISAYSLIVEDGTPLAEQVSSKEIIPAGEDEEAILYQLTMEMLAGAGYQHYEVSNYAKPGFECRHNSNYWNHNNYFGFGPSAHSFQNGRRWWNVRDVREYSTRLAKKQPVVAGQETLTERQLFEEAVMLGLRTGELDISRIATRFRIDLQRSVAGLLIALVDEHLVVRNENIFRLTNTGYLLCDEITERLLAVV